MEFATGGVPAKVVVLCRTDLFERLPGPNKNKVRQNAALNIDWYSPAANPEGSRLITLINHRASLSSTEPVDVFDTYLPATLRSDGTGNIRELLLENTRHVPRDIIMLFNNLQNYSGDGVMTRSQVTSALAKYSRDYFIPEVLDELDGYISGEDIHRFMRLVGSIRRISVSLADLRRGAINLAYPRDFDLIGILRVLFECSAVGNLEEGARPSGRVANLEEGARSSAKVAIFKYRNRQASLNESKSIVLHRGLWSGLGLRW
jgi:hypothetical protein